MDILIEETIDDENLQTMDALVDEQCLALFELCDTNKNGYIVKEDLRQLERLIPNFSSDDFEQQLFREAGNKKFVIKREIFVRAIKPFLLKQNTPKQKKKPIKEVSKSMFRTISLDNNDETKLGKPLSSSESTPRKKPPKLSISLDEKLGNTDFINLRTPSSIPKDLGSEGLSFPRQDSRPSMDSDDYESIPMNSPFYDRTFSIPDDNSTAITTLKKRPEERDEEIEKRNHNEIKEMLEKTRQSSLDVIKTAKLERPSNFGPTSLLEHSIVADDVRSPDRIFKIVFVGDSAVGKTCFLHRFCHNRFKPLFNATVGVDFTVKSIKLVDRLVAVQLWDTAGQERFRSITKQYFRKADSVILMYDVTSEQSFLNVRNWIESVRVGVGDCCVLCLVGNKVDLASNEAGRKVSYENGKQIAQEFDMLFFETSAFTGLGINDCMKAVAIRLQQREDDQLEEALRLEMIIQNSKRSWCCV